MVSEASIIQSVLAWLGPLAFALAAIVVAFVVTSLPLQVFLGCTAVVCAALAAVYAWPGELLQTVALGVVALGAFGGFAAAIGLVRERLVSGRADAADGRDWVSSPHTLGAAAVEAPPSAPVPRSTEQYFELATRHAQVTVFYQDASLRYRWIVNPRPDLSHVDVIGATDDELLSEPTRSIVIGHKRRALATKQNQSFEIETDGGAERSWLRIDVVPLCDDEGGQPDGIVCTAIDITRSKRLDMMRSDLSRRLAETLQRFNLALRSERIVVFSQDLDLRYTWVNSDETQVGSVLGRTDFEILPEDDQPAIVELKRQVIAGKQPASAEVGVGRGLERRWYDLHIEPNLAPDGSVLGVTGASIDITHRKRNEEQMRLVMRELTHRTKNLLAVVIAIARQTSQQDDSLETFVPALVSRLRALSAAQDLIVADDWAGVNIADLMKVLLHQHAPAQSTQISLKGPSITLSPEAAQNLGLAIHELGANAAKYGALSTREGAVSAIWSEELINGRRTLKLSWSETGGPAVLEPSRSGFGMMVIERNLSRALSADVSMTFASDGLKATILVPLDEIVTPNVNARDDLSLVNPH